MIIQQLLTHLDATLAPGLLSWQNLDKILTKSGQKLGCLGPETWVVAVL